MLVIEARHPRAGPRGWHVEMSWDQPPQGAPHENLVSWGTMNEELVSILQPIQEKLDQLLDAQSAIPSEVWAVGGATIVAAMAFAGVVYAAHKAEQRQRIEQQLQAQRHGTNQ